MLSGETVARGPRYLEAHCGGHGPVENPLQQCCFRSALQECTTTEQDTGGAPPHCLDVMELPGLKNEDSTLLPEDQMEMCKRLLLKFHSK